MTTSEGWQPDGSYVPCGACGWAPMPEQLRLRLPGTPLRMPGVTHYAHCPRVQFMTPAEARELNDRLAEMSRRRRLAAAEASRFWIG